MIALRRGPASRRQSGSNGGRNFGSDNGILSEVIRPAQQRDVSLNRTRFRRSSHPVRSPAVWSKAVLGNRCRGRRVEGDTSRRPVRPPVATAIPAPLAKSANPAARFFGTPQRGPAQLVAVRARQIWLHCLNQLPEIGRTGPEDAHSATGAGDGRV